MCLDIVGGLTCPACSRETEDAAEFCPSCGAATQSTVAFTAGEHHALVNAADHTPSRKSQPPPQFTTGSVLAERYRIVYLLGRGGMGEVYRADDLRLSQTVALKFLPASLAQDETALSRFVGEVRVARQITHPNVCRVYDIGEAEGRTFLSMEYIDGEDLASLLRRIGRLPQDKALDIARQLCAGLEAAHQAGVLHRDLKPANVMIDGRGRALIADFGLAGLAEELSEARGSPGTPAYMAPEQRSRGEVSIRSDMYSLGLVLHEAFTGKRAANPPAFMEGVDRFVEKAIQRCLEQNPADRPASAAELVRMLPGGDLAEAMAVAMAAGETPSPEMVAAAGGQGALERGTAWMLLSGVLAGIAMIYALAPRSTELGLAPMELSPEVLVVRAESVVKKLGYADPPADKVAWFDRNRGFLLHRSTRMRSPEAWRTLRTAEQSHQLFRYRQSPQPLAAINWLSMVNADDPPWNVSGMINLTLDTRGPLLSFVAIPPQLANPPGESGAGTGAMPDWPALFAESGLAVQRFKVEPPIWMAPVPFDAVAGWVGTYPQDPAAPIHVSAAALHGKPVYFEVAGPWSPTPRQQPAARSTTSRISAIVLSLCVLGLLALSILVARRNHRRELGDSAGSLRIAGFSFLCFLARNVLLADHASPLEGQYIVFFENLGLALVLGAFVGLMYMALEPYVRRRWPQLLIGWSRVLTGNLRDPLVGRDILVGCLFGVVIALVYFAARSAPAWMDVRGWTAFYAEPWALGSANRFLALLCDWVGDAVLYALIHTLLLFLALVIGRKRWLGWLLAWAVIAILHLSGEAPALDLMQALIVSALIVWVAARYGILACAATMYCAYSLWSAPLTLVFSNWYALRSTVMVAFCLVLALYGFKTSLGKNTAFATGLLDHDPH